MVVPRPCHLRRTEKLREAAGRKNVLQKSDTPRMHGCCQNALPKLPKYSKSSCAGPWAHPDQSPGSCPISEEHRKSVSTKMSSKTRQVYSDILISWCSVIWDLKPSPVRGGVFRLRRQFLVPLEGRTMPLAKRESFCLYFDKTAPVMVERPIGGSLA